MPKLVLAAAVFACLAPSSASGFCRDGIVRDYARPLQRMPDLRDPPVPEHLPFAPARVYLGQVGRGPLLVGSSEVGVNLSFSPYPPGRVQSPRLDWQVGVRIAEVDRRGRSKRVVALLERQVERLRVPPGRSTADLLLTAPISKPAFYRTEVTIVDANGKRLARFGEYVRLLRPSLEAAVSLNASAFHPGETLTATLENLGTESLFYGLGHGIESFDGSAWSRSSIHGSGIVPAIGLSTGPGAKASCWSFQIPAEAPPGLYRFVWTGSARYGRLVARTDRPLTLYSEFTILPPA